MVEKTKKVVKKTEEKPDVKKVALDYLQTKSLELRAKMPQLLDIQFAEDPDRLVLTVDTKLSKTPKLAHNGVKFEVEVVVQTDAKDAPEIAGEKVNRILAKYPGAAHPDTFYHHTAEPAVSPAQDGSGTDSKAYKAWKERNKGIKSS